MRPELLVFLWILGIATIYAVIIIVVGRWLISRQSRESERPKAPTPKPFARPMRFGGVIDADSIFTQGGNVAAHGRIAELEAEIANAHRVLDAYGLGGCTDHPDAKPLDQRCRMLTQRNSEGWAEVARLRERLYPRSCRGCPGCPDDCPDEVDRLGGQLARKDEALRSVTRRWSLRDSRERMTIEEAQDIARAALDGRKGEQNEPQI